MAVLSDWLVHRACIVGLSWPGGVAEAIGVAPALLESIDATGLRHVGRSARAYLARALKVSVRDLEALGGGTIQWIADDRRVDFDRVSPNVLRAPLPPPPVPIGCPRERGIPVLGRILPTGRVSHDEDWTTDEGRRLAMRYPQLPDAFALELLADAGPYSAGMYLIFQVILPGELVDAELALLTRGDVYGETDLCIVHRAGATEIRCASPMTGAEEGCITLSDILRAARIIPRDLISPRTFSTA